MTEQQPEASLHTRLCDLLGCEVPVLLAGMGGVSRWELAAAVANAGGYGILGMVRESPDLITKEVTAMRAATDRPFAVNLIVHKSNARLEQDLALCVKHQVPLIITSLGAREDVNEAIHGYGGLVFHDIINNRFAKKAIEKGADGLVAVAAGAGSPTTAATRAPTSSISAVEMRSLRMASQ